MWKNGLQRGRPQITIWRMCFARWTITATHTHTWWINNTFCFSTATTVPRTRLIVTSIRKLLVLLYILWDNNVHDTSHTINSTSKSQSSNVQIRRPVAHCCNCNQVYEIKFHSETKARDSWPTTRFTGALLSEALNTQDARNVLKALFSKVTNFNKCIAHLVQCTIQTNKWTTNILKIFYIPYALLHVLMHLHHLQAVVIMYFAKVTELLKLQLNRTSRLW